MGPELWSAGTVTWLLKAGMGLGFVLPRLLSCEELQSDCQRDERRVGSRPCIFPLSSLSTSHPPVYLSSFEAFSG